MHCANCRKDNQPGSKFCAECGAGLSSACPRCGAATSPPANFCSQCGALLEAQAAKPQPPSREQVIAGERRHLTILFCDLVGSVTLTSQLDPEEWRATVAGYQRATSDAITRFEGVVMRYVGDGIMAFFGYPVAHDNDPERAARAGLAILDAIAQLNEQGGHTKLAVRIGIDSGRVVVGTGAGSAVDAFGDTANIAARVQAAAAPDTVVITGETQRLIAGLFVVEDLGVRALKGLEREVRLFRVIRPSGMGGRFQAMTAAGLTPFIGREDELRSLLSRWQSVLDGEGQVALIIGEAGIGKSRLLQRFREQIAGTPHTWIEAGAGAFYQNTPFYPVSEILRQFSTGSLDQAPVAQLASRLTAVGLAPAEAIPLLAPLLNLSLPPEYPPSSLSSEQQRRRLLATMIKWVLGSARTRPLVIALEDLHWADPSTLELIALLVEQGATAPLMLLYTARPEFPAPWPLRAHHSQLTLNRLSARNVRTMVGEVAAHKALSDETIATVVERTGGVPLFVEELTRAVLESGNAELTAREIPVTLHDSLMARLDKLGPAKEVAQVGAVIGREFSYELLYAMHPVPEDELQTEVKALTDAELLYVRGIPPQAMYTFKHALIQDAAYEALLKTRRRELHRHVASALSDKFPELAEAQPELLAHHYTAAGMSVQAVPYWQRAGQRTLERSANVEAIRYLTKGLELLQPLPNTPERAQQELTLQITLGSALVVNRGYAAPEVEKAYTRARELCQQLGETPQLFPVLWGLWDFYLVRAELQTGRELGEQLLTLAQRAQDPALLLEAHDALGQTLWALGEFAPARAQLEQGMALYDPRQHRSLAFLYGGEDPGVICFCYAARVLWYLGYPDQALGRINEALALAQELSHPHSLAVALWQAAALHQHRREGQAAQGRAEAAIKLSTEQGFPHILAYGTSLRGWALAEQGQEKDGIAQVRWGVAAWQDTGAEIGRTNFLALLAEAYGKAGQAEKGLAALADAPTMVDKTRDRRCEAELYRLKGELLLAQASKSQKAEIETDSQGEAEACFLQAIEIAQKQQAKSWELRASMNLARLWQQQGKRHAARDMLSTIYNWFAEGFNTADLKDAKALLDELRS